jgi:hypothetical protein
MLKVTDVLGQFADCIQVAETAWVKAGTRRLRLSSCYILSILYGLFYVVLCYDIKLVVFSAPSTFPINRQEPKSFCQIVPCLQNTVSSFALVQFVAT